jgi:serine/threonine protein kinase
MVRELGEGGMGEVWLAQRVDGIYQGEVAIKTLHPYFAQGAMRDRFLREAQLLGKLTHAHIARLLDAGVDGGIVYLRAENPGGACRRRSAATTALELRESNALPSDPRLASLRGLKRRCIG